MGGGAGLVETAEKDSWELLGCDGGPEGCGDDSGVSEPAGGGDSFKPMGGGGNSIGAMTDTGGNIWSGMENTSGLSGLSNELGPNGLTCCEPGLG